MAIIDSSTMILSSYLQGFDKFVKVGYINGLTASLGNLLILVLLTLSKNVILYVVILVLLRFTVFIFLGDEARKHSIFKNIRIHPRSILSLELVNRHTFIGSLAGPFISQADKMIIGIAGGVSLIPIYSFAQSVLAAIHGFIYGIGNVFFKTTSTFSQRGQKLQQRTEFIQRWGIAMFSTIAYAIMVWVVPYFYYYLILPHFTINSILFTYLAAIQGMLIANGMVTNSILMSYKYLKLLSLQEWIKSILVFAFSFIFGILFGGIGVAYARLGFIFSTLHSLYYYKRKFSFSNNRLLMPYFICFLFPISIFLSFVSWQSNYLILFVLLQILLIFGVLFLDYRLNNTYTKRYIYKVLAKSLILNRWRKIRQ